MPRPRALALTAIWLLVSILFVLAVSDFPVASRASGATGAPRRGALAVRDDVVPFQKWGTKMFTLPALERRYDDVRYFTMSERDGRVSEIVLALEQLLERDDAVDVFLLAHTNYLYLYLERIDPELRSRLRLVYDTGCGDAYQAGMWRALGADVHVGHPGALSISPLFYFYFLRRWGQGWAVADAVADANARTSKRLGLAGPLFSGVSGAVDLATSTRAVVDGDGSATLVSTHESTTSRKNAEP
jgi:hypothetical protein